MNLKSSSCIWLMEIKFGTLEFFQVMTHSLMMWQDNKFQNTIQTVAYVS